MPHDRIPERVDVHVHLHFGPLAEVGSQLVLFLSKILHKLERLDKMATIGDLNTAVDNLTGVLTANDARVATLATAVSDAASRAVAHDADLDAQIQALKDQIAAGGDPAALQAAVDKIAAASTQGLAEGAGLDAATSALAAVLPPPAPPAEPVPVPDQPTP